MKQKSVEDGAKAKAGAKAGFEVSKDQGEGESSMDLQT